MLQSLSPIMLIIVIILQIGAIIYLYTKFKNIANYVDKITFYNGNYYTAEEISSELIKNYDKTRSNDYDSVVTKINNADAFIKNKTPAMKIYNDAFSIISQDTLVCQDINNIQTCSCLFDSCSQLKQFPNYLLIDRPYGFNSTTGYSISGNIMPNKIVDGVRITNEFSITFFINISKTCNQDRILFNWSNLPSIIIRNDSDSDYGGKYKNALDIRFENLGFDGIFNVTANDRGNCVPYIPLYKWTHIAITAKDKLILVYIDGLLSKTINTLQPIKIGDPNQWISIGKSMNDKANNPSGILLAKMRWFSNELSKDSIIFFVNEYYGR